MIIECVKNFLKSLKVEYDLKLPNNWKLDHCFYCKDKLPENWSGWWVFTKILDKEFSVPICDKCSKKMMKQPIPKQTISKE
jgi:hypothetical protein